MVAEAEEDFAREGPKMQQTAGPAGEEGEPGLEH